MASRDELQKLLEPYLTIGTAIVAPVATLSSVFLIYGVYTVIFGRCIHVILHRENSHKGVYSVCTTLLFTLATIFVSIETFGLTQQAIVLFRAAKTQDLEPLAAYLRQDAGKTAWACITSLIFPLMNILADIMLIHRSYILWSWNKILLCILTVAAFILNGLFLAIGIMGSIGISAPERAYVYDIAVRIDNGNGIAIAAFNALLSLLTGGRIWWITREARRQMGKNIDERYKTVVAVILESGILYPTTLIITIVVALTMDPDSQGTIPFDLNIIAALMSGFAPTLIMVRVSYGKSVDSVRQMTEIQFGERSALSGGNVSPGAVDIRS